MTGDIISRQAAKSKAVYSPERHEKVVPVAELDWLPSVETEKCGDCISREAVLKIIADKCKVIRTYPEAYGAVKRLPTVEPERKMGKWVHMVGWWECDQCHAEYTDMPTCMGEVMYKYCPMCGVKMEVTDE